jgi:adenosine/AMP kinase
MKEAVPRLMRVTGNDEHLKGLAGESCLRIAASHSFFIAMDNAFLINLLNALKALPAVVTIFVASANQSAGGHCRRDGTSATYFFSFFFLHFVIIT